MSLIQEALKRQIQDSGDKSPAPASSAQGPATPPLSDKPTIPSLTKKDLTGPEVQPPSQETSRIKRKPPPVPEIPPPTQQAEQQPIQEMEPPPLPASSSSGPKTWLTVVGVAVVAILLIGTGIWAMLLAFQQWKNRKTETLQKAVNTALNQPSGTATQQQVLVSTEQKQLKPVPVGTVKSVDKPATKPEETAKQSTIKEIQPIAEITQEPIKAASSVPPATPEPVAEAPQKPPPLEWPLLTLTGIAGKGTSGSVIINNEVVGVGDSIENVNVVSISDQGATLEFQGERMFLKVRNSTK